MFKFQVFCNIKLCKKKKCINRIINNIQFEQNLAYMSRTYGTCNSTIRFLKFTSNKKKYEKSLMGLEILERNLIYYLLFGLVLVPLLVNWDPFETSFEASKTILFTGICSFFKEFQLLCFFFFFLVLKANKLLLDYVFNMVLLRNFLVIPLIISSILSRPVYIYHLTIQSIKFPSHSYN